MRRVHGIIIGEATAEQIKEEVGSAFESKIIRKNEFRGRAVSTGLPVSFEVTNTEILENLLIMSSSTQEKDLHRKI